MQLLWLVVGLLFHSTLGKDNTHLNLVRKESSVAEHKLLEPEDDDATVDLHGDIKVATKTRQRQRLWKSLSVGKQGPIDQDDPDACSLCVDCPNGADCVCGAAAWFPPSDRMGTQMPGLTADMNVNCNCQDNGGDGDGDFASDAPSWCEQLDCRCDQSDHYCFDKWDDSSGSWKCVG